MKKQKKYGIVFKLIGLTLIVLTFLNLWIHTFVDKMPMEGFFWFCNITTVALGIGFIFSSKLIISAVLITSLPAQYLWMLSFVLLFFNISILKLAGGVFNNGISDVSQFVTILLHVIMFPLALIGTFILGFSRKAIYFVLIFVLLVFSISYFFTEPLRNINCTFYPCKLNLMNHYYEIMFSDFYFTKLYLFKAMMQWFLIFLISYFFWRLFFKYKKVIFVWCKKHVKKIVKRIVKNLPS